MFQANEIFLKICIAFPYLKGSRIVVAEIWPEAQDGHQDQGNGSMTLGLRMTTRRSAWIWHTIDLRIISFKLISWPWPVVSMPSWFHLILLLSFQKASACVLTQGTSFLYMAAKWDDSIFSGGGLTEMSPWSEQDHLRPGTTDVPGDPGDKSKHLHLPWWLSYRRNGLTGFYSCIHKT